MDILIMKFLGVKLSADKTKYFKYHNIYSFIVNGFFFVTFALAQLLSLLWESENLRQVAACAYVMVTMINTLTKSFYLHQNKKLLWELISYMDDAIFLPKNEIQLQSAMRSFELYRKSKLVILSMCTAAILGSFIKPRYVKDFRWNVIQNGMPYSGEEIQHNYQKGTVKVVI